MRMLFLLTLLISLPLAAQEAADIRILQRPPELAFGRVDLPVRGGGNVERLVLYTNGIRWAAIDGSSGTFTLNLPKYLRRLRLRVDGLDAEGRVVGSDEVVVNDPQPPFRVRLSAIEPGEEGQGTMSASIVSPPGIRVSGVEFWLGETLLSVDETPPWSATWKSDEVADAGYARVVARTAGGAEANDVFFFGSGARESVDVVLKRIPVSVPGGGAPLRASDVRIRIDGQDHPVEALSSASDEPLRLILLMDSSESMLEELPILQKAAREFSREIIDQGGSIAIVGFHQRTFWLTPFSRDPEQIDRAVASLRPLGRTHLYDSVIEMLFQLQKQPGRKALVVFTDGANQGGEFDLEHMVHYARYSGVPIYPVVRNTMLQRLMRVGVGRLQTRRIAQMARETGATWFLVNRPHELPGVYAKIADELEHQYTLMFYPPEVTQDSWRPLQVQARDGRRLRAPTGFFP